MNDITRLVAFDLDGTVIAKGQGMTGRTSNALQKAHNNGCVNVIVTGRSIHMLDASLTNAPYIDYVISSNGARITRLCDKKIIAQNPMQKSDATAVIGLCEKPGISFSAQTDSCAAFEWRGFLPFLAKRKSVKAPAFNKFNYQILASFLHQTKRVFSVRKMLSKHDDTVLEKLDISSPDAYVRDRVINIINSNFDLEVVSASVTNAEVTAKGVCKGSSLDKLLLSLDIPKDAAVAFGDSGNDISMKGAVACFWAMENGSDDIKAAADKIAPPVYEDGVAKVLEELKWN